MAAEIRRSSERPTSDLTAYDLYLRALSNAYTWEKGTISAALDLLWQANERDPQYAPALSLAAMCQQNLHINGWTKDPETSRREAINLARRALRVAGDDPLVLGNVAYVLGYFGENVGAAIELIDRALAFNPSFAIGWQRSGWLRLWTGEPDLAITHFETALRLSPRDRPAGSFMGIGAGHFLARRFDDAAVMLLRAVQGHPGWAPTYRVLAACYAHMGRLDEAREIVSRLHAITPVVFPSIVPFRKPADRELYLSGLRLAAGGARLGGGGLTTA